MNKEHLRKYFHDYGETKLLVDLSSILDELRKEWAESNSDVSSAFLNSSTLIAEAAEALEGCEAKYQSNEGMSLAEIEFVEIQQFFSKMDFKAFKKYYESHSLEFNDKLLRLKELKDIIDADKPKK